MQLRFKARGYWKVWKLTGIWLFMALIWTSGTKLRTRSRRANSFAYSNIDTSKDSVFIEGCVDFQLYRQQPEYAAQNATFVMLTRNEELRGVLATIRSMERHFNQWYQYPYVLLNNEPFDSEFIRQVTAATRAKVHFGVLSELEWDFPPEVREKLVFRESIEDQGDRGIMYGNLESYHKMCRFYAGAFYKHSLVAQYEWYWRIEPDVEFFCDLTYDPFYEMSRRGKKYGFTVFIGELYWTVPNLFRHTRSFIRKNKVKMGTLWPLVVRSYNTDFDDDEVLRRFINFDSEVEPELSKELKIQQLLENVKKAKSQDVDREALELLIERASRKPPILEDKFDGEEFNLCHFWSNFEIARVDIFSTGLYSDYFKFLEESGGFWSERWGDAPVHTLGLGMMLDVEDVHYFRDIGYQHSTLAHCPINKAGRQLPYVENVEYQGLLRGGNMVQKVLKDLSRVQEPEKQYGVGCRCKCPRKRDIEDTSQCFRNWYDLTSGDR
ncbi:LAME_0G12376g1_1 [Lachancea meyersii CBS 8951]|uniref:LAME_0G12376g1_1 n=1 Tax=Lachancea meyersii CBS 8951 TaxID=1266667 RepID=A0A1G4K9Q8_9SACH|nr:LAME_0G12376g1_1 [Lachancea meyersii CBS 8951]